MYNPAGFSIAIIHADNELKLLMDNAKDNLDVTMTYTNPGDNVPEIYQNARKAKERYCAQYHRLNFQNIPKVVIRYLDFEVVKIIELSSSKRRFITIL